MEKTIYGPGFLEGENASSTLAQLMMHVKDSIFDILTGMQDEKSYLSKNPDSGLQCLMSVLANLAELDESIGDGIVYKTQVAEWKEFYLNWFEQNKKSVPAKYRDEFLENTIQLFDKLESLGSVQPRDMWDMWRDF